MESSLHVYTCRNDFSFNFDKFNPLKVLILGKGKSSDAVIEYFKNKNAIIEILEPKNKKQYYDFIKRLPLFDICFRSPGIPINKSVYTLGKLLSKEFTNELVYALKFIKTKNVIVVTGSNGKTSLCTLMYELLSVYNKTHIYGNIGKTLLNNLEDINEGDYLVIEASSFQLEDLNFYIDVGIIKNLLPNHLNATYSKATYYASKKRLELYSNYFINGENFSDNVYVKDNVIFVDNKHFININELKFNHPSFIQDILICLKVLHYYGLDYNLIKNVLKNHQNVKYRIDITEHNNIIFVNDGKSSTSSSSAYCFSLFKGKRILILGGIHKSDKFKLNINIGDEVLIYGRDRNKIKNELKCGNLFETLDDALNSINIKENSTIIFSPGCASFDQYLNYEERSKVFDKWVNKWIK